jgi:hypothetical protein
MNHAVRITELGPVALALASGVRRSFPFNR